MDARHLARGLVLQRADGAVALLAAGRQPVELRLVPGQPEGAHGGRGIVHDLCGRGGGVGEVARSAEPAAAETVAACGAGQGAACEVRAEGGGEGGADGGAQHRGADGGRGEAGAVVLGCIGARAVGEAPNGRVDGAMGAVPSSFVLTEEGGFADGLARGVADEDGDGFGGGTALGGFCEALSDDLGRLLEGVSGRWLG